ncbi:uncharacterized protein LOC116617990 [Nematostella vectensis]|uniref:uncharacterized protein LOC116617990 n=1 Tax=Nematostella vectensis TaxID=45351 RepID=UPI00138FC1AC|nr:uncharacterized protein LOC116617990 [Nematostella vectensis]XP_048576793.1 uncharacterized protein LOC116617990 [Nematostella vectensis]
MAALSTIFIYLLWLNLLILGIGCSPIVSPFFKPPPGQGYEKEHAIKDKYYENFYAKGKKNNIAKLPHRLSKHQMQLTRDALLKATSAQTTALVAAAQAARSSLQIARLAKKAQDLSVKRATWALETVRTAAKAEEVAVNAIETLFM